MKDQDLQPWLSNLIQGDPQAFHYIYEYTKKDVYRTVYFLANNKQDTADIVSEVYIQLCKSLSSYRPEQSFTAWLRGLAVRQVHNWNRQLWRRFRLFERKKALEMAPECPSSDDRLMRSEARREMLEMVDMLSGKLKDVVVLRYYHEYSFEEMAAILEIPVGTVKSRHHQAMKKLRLMTGQSYLGKEAAPHVH